MKQANIPIFQSSSCMRSKRLHISDVDNLLAFAVPSAVTDPGFWSAMLAVGSLCAASSTEPLFADSVPLDGSVISWACFIALNSPPSFADSCAGVPSSTMTPFSTTTMRCTLASVDSRCAMISVVAADWAPAESSAACTVRSLVVSSAEVASSKSIMRGARIRARAMHTRCRWPPDSCDDDTLAPAMVS
mmetsp:Transcript_60941/g.98676  ORF Transcript_60941/g.98676 Transcript_60941/m.98676 type:complete len:189 (-) Transcript_60941:1610-2176(-)